MIYFKILGFIEEVQCLFQDLQEIEDPNNLE